MGGQRTAIGLPACSGDYDCPFLDGLVLGDRLLDILQRQSELIGVKL